MTTYFVPRDEREHRLANQGQELPDYCANCGNQFMAHTNGECPAANPEVSFESPPTFSFTEAQRNAIAEVLETVAKDGLPGPRDLDVALDAIEQALK